tara:strand:+ start:40098 stop:40271 length:174 start_codon:yes stop_codon:yes gene_type:complete
VVAVFMDSLQALLSSENSLSLKDFNDIAKKLFELNSDLVDVIGQELLCLDFPKFARQ